MARLLPMFGIPTPEFATEADLCQAFLDSLSDEWKIYPEQGDWDFVVQRRQVQVGVQAKKTASMKVLSQALPHMPGEPETGPHYRAVLIGRWPGRTPKARMERRRDFLVVARHLRLIILAPSGGGWLPLGYDGNLFFKFDIRGIPYIQSRMDWRHYRWHPSSPLWVPPFEPDMPAGVPAPAHVSAFQIACLELHSICAERGWICLSDAKAVVAEMKTHLHASTLLKRFWYCTGEPAEGRQKRWAPMKERHRRFRTPAEEWPEIWKRYKEAK